MWVTAPQWEWFQHSCPQRVTHVHTRTTATKWVCACPDTRKHTHAHTHTQTHRHRHRHTHAHTCMQTFVIVCIKVIVKKIFLS